MTFPLQYLIYRFADEDGEVDSLYTVEALNLPGCVSCGATPEECHRMIQDAAQLMIGYHLDAGITEASIQWAMNRYQFNWYEVDGDEKQDAEYHQVELQLAPAEPYEDTVPEKWGGRDPESIPLPERHVFRPSEYDAED